MDKKNPYLFKDRGENKIRRRPTLPHVQRAVPSAQVDLTSEFGMRSGVTPPL